MIVVSPPLPTELSDADLETRLVEALNEMSLRDAAKAIADDLGVPRKRVYELGLTLRRTAGDPN